MRFAPHGGLLMHDKFMARQPIFDDKLKLFPYAAALPF
jgi:hypothetical protein